MKTEYFEKNDIKNKIKKSEFERNWAGLTFWKSVCHQFDSASVAFITIITHLLSTRLNTH